MKRFVGFLSLLLSGLIFMTCLLACAEMKKLEEPTTPEETERTEMEASEIEENSTEGTATKETTTEETATEETTTEEPTTEPPDPVLEILQNMTLEEKVGQLFIVLPEVYSGSGAVTELDDDWLERYKEKPAGGVILFQRNLLNSGQTRNLLASFQEASENHTGLPMFTSIDEEGGSVARIGNSGDFPVEKVPDMCLISDPETAKEKGAYIGSYLHDLGFNLDFAPVADVYTNPENAVVRYRSFGSDPAQVTALTKAFSNGLFSEGVLSCYKHFPGHGQTAGDTHEGFVLASKTLEEMEQSELIPFMHAEEDGIPFIMVSHISCPNITGDNLPATLSPVLITDILRRKYGYDGLIITDGMQMGAITASYSSAEAAERAILAGIDIILLPADFYSAYEGVLSAVSEGRITEERIDESVYRILRQKLSL